MILLDTTIRDGSYVVDFKFSSDDVESIVEKLDLLGFDYIEIGHGQGLNASSPENGIALQTDVEYMDAARKKAKHARIGFFCIPGIARLQDLKTAKEHGVSFVRIGANADEIDRAKEYVQEAKRLGLEAMVNFMKTYIITPEEFAEKAKVMEDYGADCIYIVDSSGGMLPEQIGDYFNELRKHSDIKVGFHGHDNLNMAVSNSIHAIRLGFDFVDCTMQGIGRSMGNAASETLIMALEKDGYYTKFDIPRLLEYGYVVNQYIAKRNAQNPLDLVCGYADFHSSNLKYIFKCCCEMQVDPLRLIIAYSKINKKNMDWEVLCSIAAKLAKDYDENPYDFRKYFGASYNDKL